MDPPQNPPQDPSQDAELQQAKAWLEGIRRRIPNPSQRNPDMSWENNVADLIERQLQDDRHRTWGFVIYRTTYASDADWAEFLRRLRFQLEDEFDYYGGRDVLEHFALTVLEDRARFDGATADTVRRHFQEWSLVEYPTEQQRPEGNGGGVERVRVGRSPRYRFAVQVDAEALHAVVHDAPSPEELDVTKKGWVRLIDKSWYLGRGVGRYDALEPIEGLTQHDVGWMKVPYKYVMTEWYTKCRSPNNWTVSYRRPPEVAGPPYGQ